MGDESPTPHSLIHLPPTPTPTRALPPTPLPQPHSHPHPHPHPRPHPPFPPRTSRSRPSAPPVDWLTAVWLSGCPATPWLPVAVVVVVVVVAIDARRVGLLMALN
ncbi:hypothetical protein M0802_009723 [Mischocyttarus mexicanus]|nr:hypothetical protein M0802_009723 [Mischocyttarus mexicanus]